MILTLWAAKVAEHLLFEMQTARLVVYIETIAVVVGIAVLACYPAAHAAAYTNVNDAVRDN